MRKEQFDSIAEIILAARLDTLSYSRQFNDDYGQPPTLIDKAQHFRSVAQAGIARTDDLALLAPWAEMGKVEYEHLDTGQRYLLRGNNAMAIEAGHRAGLFDSTPYLASPVLLLIYRFFEEGVHLSIAGTVQWPGSQRLEPSGEPTFIGTWYFSSDDTPGFDQGHIEFFRELDETDEGEEETE